MDLTGATWRKSSYSGGNGGTCVEVGVVARIVAVRDSKDPAGSALAFGPAAWRAFTRCIKEEGKGRA
jgi:hypothetical protein